MGLQPDYKAELRDYVCQDLRCGCGNPNAHPPCHACTHPGNPQGLINEDNWVDIEALNKIEVAVDHARRFATGKGFNMDSHSYDGLYAITWRSGEKELRYRFDTESEQPQFCARFSGWFVGPDMDTIEAAFVHAELAQWGGGTEEHAVLESARRITEPVRGVNLNAKFTRDDLRKATNRLMLEPKVHYAVVSILLSRCRAVAAPMAYLDEVVSRMQGRR